VLTEYPLLPEELRRNTHSGLPISRIVIHKLTIANTVAFSRDRKIHHSTNTPHPVHYRQTDIPVVPDCDITKSYAYTAHGNNGCHAPTITLTPNDLNTFS